MYWSLPSKKKLLGKWVVNFNVGYGFHEDVTVDDVSFVSALVTGLQQEYGFSTDNVFATGMSNGGEMSYVLACDASDLFAAIAPVAGTMMEDKYNSCQPAKALPVFEIALKNGHPNETHLKAQIQKLKKIIARNPESMKRSRSFLNQISKSQWLISTAVFFLITLLLILLLKSRKSKKA